MAPYQFSVPEAPQNLRIEKLEQFSPTHTAAYSESAAEEEEAFELLEAIELEQKPDAYPHNKKKGNNGGAPRIFD